MNSNLNEGMDVRINNAPLTSREELLEVVFGADNAAAFGADSKAIKVTLPRAAEWIDLADAGPYVDEMILPLYTDPATGKEIYASAATDKWMSDRLAHIGSKVIEDQVSS